MSDPFNLLVIKGSGVLKKIFKLDCRSFNFSKWVLPKTKSYFSSKKSNNITVGYFDFVKVNNIEINNEEHPLEKYISIKNDELSTKVKRKNYQRETLEYTSQQFLAFTNTSENKENEDINKAIYLKSSLDEFWEKPSVLRYYSFLHIQNASSKKTIYNIVNKINKCFSQNNKKHYKAICYFSLDYSDIIICSKDISVSEFSKIIFQLNYECSNYSVESNNKLIKDSFSLLSINFSFSRDVYKLVKDNRNLNFSEYKNLILSNLSKKYNLSNYSANEFNAAFNLGVQNYETFSLMSKEIIEKNLVTENDIYKMLGRHDITIVNPNADLLWLIIMQSIIDFYSTEANTQFSINSVIFNCETYIRIPFTENEHYKDKKLDKDDSSCPKSYYSASKILDEKVDNYINIKGLESEHILPILALKNSILGLLKSEFAEDFVLCIFESFVSFLDYICVKAKINYALDKEFDMCFDNYFDTINSLINSAMHSERQFIQSPSFNPVFYDIPPKLMSYYTAVSHKINSIIRTDDDANNNYSFVFRPSFSKNIRVDYYSYYETAPTDRLLAVMINENDLYYPFTVLIQICHEIAHFVGDSNRCRKERKERLLKSALFVLVYRFLISKAEVLISDIGIIKWINNTFQYVAQKDYYISSNDYSENFCILYYQVLQDILVDNNFENFNKNLFKDYLETLSEIEIVSLNYEFKKYISSEHINLLIDNEENDEINALLSIYSEIYADLQMIIIFNLSQNDYLMTFESFFKSKNDVHEYSSIYYRILNIVMFMLFIGKWEVEEQSKDIIICTIYKDINKYINYFGKDNFVNTATKMYKNNVSSAVERITPYQYSSWRGIEYWFVNIQHYLLEAYRKSQECYNNCSRTNSIIELRKNIDVIKNFNDAVEVFCLIQKTNEEYAKKLFGDCEE